jgi:hypothetical protein
VKPDKLIRQPVGVDSTAQTTGEVSDYRSQKGEKTYRAEVTAHTVVASINDCGKIAGRGGTCKSKPHVRPHRAT